MKMTDRKQIDVACTLVMDVIITENKHIKKKRIEKTKMIYCKTYANGN